MIYFVSDTHIHHHKLCASYPDRFEEYRKYATTDEMDADIVEKWNSTVSTGDDVIFLGDFILDFPGKEKIPMTYDYWNRLNGNKIWVYGNHDLSLLKQFNKGTFTVPLIPDYCFEHNARKYHCKHYPYVENMIPDEIYVHGHTHSIWKYGCGQNNVCWDAWYRPVSIDELKSPSEISVMNEISG